MEIFVLKGPKYNRVDARARGWGSFAETWGSYVELCVSLVGIQGCFWERCMHASLEPQALCPFGGLYVYTHTHMKVYKYYANIHTDAIY